MRVTISDAVACSPPPSQEARQRQFAIIREFADNPALWECGMSLFTKMSMRHDGERWLIDMEAEGRQ